MPSLIKRSNGIFYFISSIQGVRRWISTGETTRANALRKIPSLNFDKPLSLRIPLLSEYLQQFFNIGCNMYRSGTVEVYHRALSSFLNVIGDKRLSFVSRKDIDIYKHSQLQRIGPVTLNIYLRTLLAAFQRAMD